MKTANKKIRRKSSPQKNRKSNTHSTIKHLLANAHDYQENGQPEQANFLYQRVLEQQPENIFALNGLGIIALNTGMLMLATEFFNAAHVVRPNHTTVNKNLGLVYTKLRDYEKAIQHYSYILDTNKHNGEIHAELARLFMQLEKTDAALNHYRLAFEINPGDPGNFQGIVQLDATSVSAENIATVEKYLLEPNLPLEVRCSFYFSLGAVYDVSEKYDEAFANYSAANLSKIVSFDADRHVNYISDIIRTFSTEFFEQHKSFALNNSIQPVFIVGMPQSGIATVNSLLAKHDDIYAAGKLDLINNIAEKLYLTAESCLSGNMSIDELDGELLAEFSKSYLSHINAMALDNDYKVPSRIIDKKPTNFLHLGLISLLFPQARIIHCVANPLDICLSNYFRNYSNDNRYAYDQKNIALYYQQYERLMRHWNDVLPLEIYTVDYDDMVSTSEATNRELLNFIGVSQPVKSVEASTSIRQPEENAAGQRNQDMYMSPARHWRKYRKHAHAMISELIQISAIGSASKAVNGCQGRSD